MEAFLSLLSLAHDKAIKVLMSLIPSMSGTGGSRGHGVYVAFQSEYLHSKPQKRDPSLDTMKPK